MTVTAEVAKRIQEYENDFNTMGQSDPEYFLVKWNAEFIDSSKRKATRSIKTPQSSQGEH